jgi:hypothetical protein
MAGLSALKSAQRYGANFRQTDCDGRRFASGDPAVWPRGNCEGPSWSRPIPYGFEVQLLCSQGEFFRPLPFSWVRSFTFGEPNDSISAECLKAMLTLPDQCPIYPILDALDESPEISGIQSPREKVLQLVMELVELHFPNLRKSVACRPEIDVRDVLEPLTSYRMSLHFQSGQKKDIVDYIKSVVY